MYMNISVVASAPIHAFLELLFTRTLHNILCRPVAAFACKNQWSVMREEWMQCCSGYHQSSERSWPGLDLASDLVLKSYNSLPNNRILDQSKMEDFRDNKINVTRNVSLQVHFVLGRVENIMGKGENAGYQHFLLFLQCFQKLSFSRSLKVRTVW